MSRVRSTAGIDTSAVPLTTEEIGLIQRYRLSLAQIKWRRMKIMDLGADLFRQEYPEDDSTCFLTSGRCCFDREALHQAAVRIAAAKVPDRTANLPGQKDKAGNPTLISVAPATLSVWKRPERGRLYVVGADVGEGLAGGDASCAVVLERETGEQVAELHGRVPPDRFGTLLDALGRYYNLATVAVERNNHGHSTLNTLRNVCRYPRLYFYMRYDQGGKAMPVLGWPTDSRTKPILVDDLGGAISSGGLLIRSAGLVDECFTFVTTDTGSQQAQEGKFDDRVMAAGIAWQARKRGVSRGTSYRPVGW